MNNVQGIVLVIFAMAAFTVEDMFIKTLSATLPVGQILIGIGLGSGALFAALAVSRGHALFARPAWQPLLLARAGAEAIAAIAFASALSLVDISVVAAVFQVTPLAITMGAAVFLGEQVGWRRWSAITLGFVGVMLIIRPGQADFDLAVLLPIVSVIAVAARDLMTRRISVEVPSTIVSFQGFAALVPAGALLLLATDGAFLQMSGVEGVQLGVAVLFGALAYYCIVTAMRVAEASAVTPYRYTRLLFSLAVGVFVFGERPDALTLAGAGLIIGTGLYTFVREQRLARRARTQAASTAALR
ncbi:MAG: DMT family transporter [Pseudomonadota bacterium]